MNTKFFLLLVCLLTTNHTSSVIIKSISSAPTAIVEHASTSTAKPKEATQTIDLTIPEPSHDGGTRHADKPQKEHEDGKHHSFHFSRVRATKRRNLIVIVSKIALAILHVCVFLYCFMHVFQH